MSDYKEFVLEQADCMDVVKDLDIFCIQEGLIDDPIDNVISLGDCLIEEMNYFTIEDDIYQEASEAAKGSAKNIFKKIIEYIKKFFQFLAKFFKTIINKIFGKGEASATADQIAAEVVGDVPESEGSENIHFEAGPGSNLKARNITLAAKDLELKIENKKIAIRPMGFKGGIFRRHKAIGPEKTGIPEHAAVALKYFENTKLRSELNSLISDIVSRSKNISSASRDEKDRFANDIVERSTDIYKSLVNMLKPDDIIKAGFVKKSVKELEEMYREVNSFALRIDKAEVPDDDTFASTKIKIAIRDITSILNIVTYGCNQIMRNVKHMYMIDKKYAHTIKDINTLGKFVYKLIKAGIPSNYVAYNCWCIMGEDLDNRGYFSKKKLFGINGPRWGQSRATFFPVESSGHDGEVLKIAMNAVGIIGNKKELKRYKAYEQKNAADILARPTNSWEDGTIVTMEKLKPCKNYRIAAEEAEKLQRKVHEYIDRGLPLITDIHYKNVGIDENGTSKILDYGN